MRSTLRLLIRRFLPRRAILQLKAFRNRVQSLRLYRFTFPAAQVDGRPIAPPDTTPSNDLEQLGAIYQPTKRNHDYLKHYWRHFRDIRNQVRVVYEIGVQTDRSILMWEAFFPNATIVGIDIDPACKQFAGGRRTIYIGDQGDAAFLRRVVAEAGQPDIVIDDGSHIVEHQLATFNTLFPLMSEHGLYVVEDTGGVVADYHLRTVNALKQLVDAIMYWPMGVEPEDWMRLSTFPPSASWADRNIVGIAFYRWIVFIMRGHNPEDNPFLLRDK